MIERYREIVIMIISSVFGCLMMLLGLNKNIRVSTIDMITCASLFIGSYCVIIIIFKLQRQRNDKRVICEVRDKLLYQICYEVSEQLINIYSYCYPIFNFFSDLKHFENFVSLRTHSIKLLIDNLKDNYSIVFTQEELKLIVILSNSVDDLLAFVSQDSFSHYVERMDLYQEVYNNIAFPNTTTRNVDKIVSDEDEKEMKYIYKKMKNHVTILEKFIDQFDGISINSDLYKVDKSDKEKNMKRIGLNFD